jgi:hypothetical protein
LYSYNKITNVFTTTFLSYSTAAFDFHLTGHGSSPALCSEPGFPNNTNINSADTKYFTEKEVQDEKNGDKSIIVVPSRKMDKEKEIMCDGTFNGSSIIVLPIEQSVVRMPVEYHARISEKKDEDIYTTDETNPFFEKYQACPATTKDIKTNLGKLKMLIAIFCLLVGRGIGQFVQLSNTNTLT